MNLAVNLIIKKMPIESRVRLEKMASENGVSIEDQAIKILASGASTHQRMLKSIAGAKVYA